MNCVRGAGLDLASLIETHLFVVCPNNSGSSFLSAALGGCRAVWRLPQEGQTIRGFAGPVTTRAYGSERWFPGLLWASEQRWIDLFADPRGYNWPRTRKAWYWYARAHADDATVFVAKSPQHVLHVEQLATHFPNARFLFMVRDPYAVCEGICRRYRTRLAEHLHRQFTTPGRSLPTAAATHVANCLAWQRRNIEAWRDRSVFFTYEQMCRLPAASQALPADRPGRRRPAAQQVPKLDLHVRAGELRFRDPATGKDLRTYAEAEARGHAEKDRADIERNRADAAEAELAAAERELARLRLRLGGLGE